MWEITTNYADLSMLITMWWTGNHPGLCVLDLSVITEVVTFTKAGGGSQKQPIKRYPDQYSFKHSCIGWSTTPPAYLVADFR